MKLGTQKIGTRKMNSKNIKTSPVLWHHSFRGGQLRYILHWANRLGQYLQPKLLSATAQEGPRSACQGFGVAVPRPVGSTPGRARARELPALEGGGVPIHTTKGGGTPPIHLGGWLRLGGPDAHCWQQPGRFQNGVCAIPATTSLVSRRSSRTVLWLPEFPFLSESRLTGG